MDLLTYGKKLSALQVCFSKWLELKTDKLKAEEMLDSGKAEAKMREIIAAQGGNPKVKPNDLPVGAEMAEVRSEHAGKVIWLSTADIVRIAREAGAPKEKGAGLVLHSKLGETVHKDDVLFEIYAERGCKLTSALELAKTVVAHCSHEEACGEDDFGQGT